MLLFDHISPHPPAAADAYDRLGEVWTAFIADGAPPNIAATPMAGFLAWIGDASPYLTRLMHKHIAVLRALKRHPPHDCIAQICAALAHDASRAESRDDIMRLLRLGKQKIALIIALCDLAGFWDVEAVTQALTDFADLACRLSLAFLLAEAHAAEKIISKPAAAHSGIIILAMGKYGAFELNYSSDIDLIIFYTPEKLTLADGLDRRKFYITLIRDFLTLLQNQTQHGYVFRVDLRLRPNPGATAIAVSVAAGLSYYESFAQNWERAAFIKARAVAGDIQAGEAFLHALAPYIWRRNLDFAAIEDIHSMKRQIHAVRGHGQIAIAGHNIKLGRGGIREIEFFVQTQQLIAGGRDMTLRGRGTLAMLNALAQAQWISKATAHALTESYKFLRRLEHRLQMRLDEQTHTLPKDAATLTQFAYFAGFASLAEFQNALGERLGYVRDEYAALFEHAETLAATDGNLVFTGGDDDPDTIETLAKMGFARPRDMIALIREWHSGQLRAMRSTRAREMLTRLMPHLLHALAQTPAPDESLIRFDRFLRGLPAGVQLFSLFQANPHILKMLVDVIGAAPRLAAWLSHNAAAIDVMLTPDIFVPIESAAHYLEDLTQKCAQSDTMEDLLDVVRLFVHEQHFRVGLSILTEPHGAAIKAGAQFSAIAAAAVQTVLPAAIADIEQAYGRIDNATFALIAMGKFGGQEMTMASDLDMIMICDADDFTHLSDGAKPLGADIWFTRLSRRLISGLTAQTAQGALYEVDTRLRPSGNAGALVSKWRSFIDYQQDKAWTWEHMALTRARLIAGDGVLQDKLNAGIKDILCRKRDTQKLYADMCDMRARVQKERPQRSVWDVKHGAGGLIDIEFLVQTLQLHYAHIMPDILSPHTGRALTNLHAAGIISAADYDHLSCGLTLFDDLRHILSVSVGQGAQDELSPATQNLLLRTANLPDIVHLQADIDRIRRDIAAIFTRLVPA